MSSVSQVEEIVGMDGDALTARDALVTAREHGLWHLARASLVRFRYGDGFSHARALGLQLALTAVPLVIVAVGLSSQLRRESVGLVLRETILELTPKSSDPLLRRTLSPFSAEDAEGNTLALVLGAVAAVLCRLTDRARDQATASPTPAMARR